VNSNKLPQTSNNQIYMKNNGQIDWAAVRRAYSAGDVSIIDICQTHGISAGRLYRRLKKEDWPRRGPVRTAASKTHKQIHKSKIERLYLLLDRLMKEIEMEPIRAANEEGAGGAGTADRERSARTLSSLIRSFEKIKELEAEELARVQETGDDEINEADQKEAEDLRIILQERFADLSKAGNT